MKKILMFLMAITVNCFVGATVAQAVDISPLTGAAGANIISGCAGQFIPMGSAAVGVLQEVWTGEMVKKFRYSDQAEFLDDIPNYDQYVDNDVIHLVDVGADPDVLINNTTYPIPIQDIPDADIAISLDKFQTKVTPITDDELYACSYDRMGSVVERHSEAITEAKHNKAIHALAPASNTAKTPVLFTSGDTTDDGLRKMFTRKDIIALKKAFDDTKVPKKGRRLVLCNDHVQDLLLVDQKFADQYYNYTTGKIANLYGFDIYEYVENPIFDQSGTKKSYGAVPAAGDFQASVAFYTKRMFRCSGSTKMYHSAAETDPQNQRNLVNFRHYFLVLPKKQEAMGAIVSKSA